MSFAFGKNFIEDDAAHASFSQTDCPRGQNHHFTQSWDNPSIKCAWQYDFLTAAALFFFDDQSACLATVLWAIHSSNAVMDFDGFPRIWKNVKKKPLQWREEEGFESEPMFSHTRVTNCFPDDWIAPNQQERVEQNGIRLAVNVVHLSKSMHTGVNYHGKPCWSPLFLPAIKIFKKTKDFPILGPFLGWRRISVCIFRICHQRISRCLHFRTVHWCGQKACIFDNHFWGSWLLVSVRDKTDCDNFLPLSTHLVALFEK